MHFLFIILIVAAAYLFGSIPFGLIVVKLMTGRDIRTVASGRTGGTNAMRAAGPFAGLLTAALDVLKAAAAVWLVRVLTPNVWVHAAAACAVILGHNHSIFLVERTPDGKIRLRGGAGGAAAGGGAFGLWEPIGLLLIPVGLLVWNLVGYASITTLSVGFVTLVAFTIRAALGLGPWAYVVYAVIAEALMAWALRPNLKRLVEGTERRHGLPAYLEKKKEQKEAEYRVKKP
jgi:acyl phosphate:glycerol-3-phosphate acyltransferase